MGKESPNARTRTPNHPFERGDGKLCVMEDVELALRQVRMCSHPSQDQNGLSVAVHRL